MWNWKRVLIAVTAFTIGHSLSLAIGGLNLLPINAELIEFLIPLTIAIAAVSVLIRSRKYKPEEGLRFFYLITLIFGLIHGLGFANYFRVIIDQSQNIWEPLLLFNLGVEGGQLLIVLGFLLLSLIANMVFRIKKPNWMIFWGGFCLAPALFMIFENKIW